MKDKDPSERASPRAPRKRVNAPARARKKTSGAARQARRGESPKASSSKTRKPEPKASASEKSRTTDRRDRSGNRLTPSPRAAAKGTYMLPTNWWLMAAAYLSSAVTAFAINVSLPSLPAIILFALAPLLTVATRWFNSWERDTPRDENVSFAAASTVVVVPALMYGFGFAIEAFAGRIGTFLFVGAIVSISAVSAVLLSGRAIALFGWKIAVWSPFVFLSKSPSAYLVLAIFVVLCYFTGRYQMRVDRERAERNLADARIRNRAVDILNDYENTRQGWFWETDRRGQLTYLSPPIAKHLGTTPEELLGRPILDLFEMGNDNREGERSVNFHLSARSAFQELAVQAATGDGERWWSISGRPVFDNFKNFCGFRGSGTDLTEKKRSQEHASRLAHFDSLTGLANRFQMSQTLNKILSSPQEQNRECAVFLLDLDRFKHVNDTLGHPAGDALLKQVSQRLDAAVGESGRVGRLGGDEFKVILPGRNPRAMLAQLAADIIRSLSQPYSIEGHRVVIGASIGIAISPDDAKDIDLIIRNADLALYAAKDGGRGRYHFYAKDLHSAAEERSKLEEDLREAIENDALDIQYQPVVECSSETITGFEALIRWFHPQQGAIRPDKFIPIAEDTGLIQDIGAWAIRRTCLDLASWPENIRCAVNVSPLQFSNPDLPNVITRAISDAGISPSRLELEITESVFLSDDEGTDAMFSALKKIGVRLALDDFGTGYSSLGYLKTAPFDKIKIDQSFVRGATQPGSRNGAIIASITSLAQALGMDTTAEGVETLDELDLVRMHGCSHVQGYIYDKPLSLADASQKLRDGPTAVARGPKSARAPRQTMLRKIVLENAGQYYNGTVRNISVTGALVEGLYNVPVGTLFRLALSETLIVSGTTRWSKDDRMGVEFARALETDPQGGIVGLKTDTQFAVGGGIRKKA
ncbi:hypothetical protein MTsPCn7_20400 [Altererythrobacter sp. MTPC7]